MANTERPRKRLTKPPVKLAADAPLRGMSPEEIKRLDAQTLQRADESKARARHR